MIIFGLTVLILISLLLNRKNQPNLFSFIAYCLLANNSNITSRQTEGLLGRYFKTFWTNPLNLNLLPLYLEACGQLDHRYGDMCQALSLRTSLAGKMRMAAGLTAMVSQFVILNPMLQKCLVYQTGFDQVCERAINCSLVGGVRTDVFGDLFLAERVVRGQQCLEDSHPGPSPAKRNGSKQFVGFIYHRFFPFCRTGYMNARDGLHRL